MSLIFLSEFTSIYITIGPSSSWFPIPSSVKLSHGGQLLGIISLVITPSPASLGSQLLLMVLVVSSSLIVNLVFGQQAAVGPRRCRCSSAVGQGARPYTGGVQAHQDPYDQSYDPLFPFSLFKIVDSLGGKRIV